MDNEWKELVQETKESLEMIKLLTLRRKLSQGWILLGLFLNLLLSIASLLVHIFE